MKHIFFALLTIAAMSALPAFAQVKDPEIQKAETYLQGLRTAQADFIQSSSLGSRLSGQFYLDRPGRLRFDYNEVKDFVVADGLFVYFYDSQLGEQSNAPIGQTLADFLLRKDLRLSGDLSVQQLYKKDGHTYITVVQTDDPSVGNVELVFQDVPYTFKGWKVTDAQNQVTEVQLKNLQTGVKFTDSALFAYHDPKGRKQFND